ncbi:MAG: hypothetical protein IIU06_00370, partial [Erysipelotrichales bacterium]|nr:hypothetical protein [Erysipelotrichales bacterium]
SCTIAQHFDVIAENGVQLKKVMCAGGGTKNEVWLQCVADMIERPVAVSEVTIGSAYGDALMATLGGGAFSSWAELDEAVKPARVYEPNPDNFATYRALRDRFRRLYEANKEIFVEEPRVLGVSEFGASSVDVTLIGKVQPLKQWQVERDWRLLVKSKFDAEGISIPFQTITVHEAGKTE